MDIKKILFCGYGPLALACLKSIIIDYKVILVLTYPGSENDLFLEFLKDSKINHKYDKPNESDPQEYNDFDYLLSVNYKYIFDKKFINRFKHAVNLHGSLLPKYRGRSPHIWAIINGEKFTGVTAHRISEIVDMGNILAQRVIPIDPDDSGGSLIMKFEEIYPEVMREVLVIVEHSVGHPQNEDKATYFGKRNDLMSYIDTKNTTLEVMNFIRALRKPYPPAYTYLSNGKKVLIESVCISKVKPPKNHKGIFTFNEKLYLATNDGVLEIIDYELSN